MKNKNKGLTTNEIRTLKDFWFLPAEIVSEKIQRTKYSVYQLKHRLRLSGFDPMEYHRQKINGK